MSIKWNSTIKNTKVLVAFNLFSLLDNALVCKAFRGKLTVLIQECFVVLELSSAEDSNPRESEKYIVLRFCSQGPNWPWNSLTAAKDQRSDLVSLHHQHYLFASLFLFKLKSHDDCVFMRSALGTLAMKRMQLSYFERAAAFPMRAVFSF